MESRLRIALSDMPVVAVNGPRQSGKTTLVRMLKDDATPYLTLDDATLRQNAIGDPTGFVRALDKAVIDEAQRAPPLLLAIKQSVDEDRRPGRFLLTGSTNFWGLPSLGDSLAGRMEVLRLLPLSQGEIRAGSPTAFLDALFEGRAPQAGAPVLGADLVSLVLTGGYPDALTRSTPGRRRDWHRAYLDALVARDIPEIAAIDKPTAMARMFEILARHDAQLLNLTQVGAAVGVTTKTADHYIDILDRLYLTQRLQPWSRNELSRLIKTPKLHFLDSGLAASALGLTEAAVARDRSRFGPLLETFVFQELQKLASWRDDRTRICFYRDTHQNEVDFVLENEAREVVGIEVKGGATVSPADLKGLKKLAALAGDSFRFGAVLYDSDRVLPLAPKIAAVPISALWA